MLAGGKSVNPNRRRQDQKTERREHRKKRSPSSLNQDLHNLPDKHPVIIVIWIVCPVDGGIKEMRGVQILPIEFSADQHHLSLFKIGRTARPLPEGKAK